MFVKVMVSSDGDCALVNPDFVMHMEGNTMGGSYMRLTGSSPCALNLKEDAESLAQRLFHDRTRPAHRGLVQFVVKKHSHGLMSPDESQAWVMYVNPDQVVYVGMTTQGGWTLIKGEFGDLWVKGTLDEVGEKLGGVYPLPAYIPARVVHVSEE